MVLYRNQFYGGFLDIPMKRKNSLVFSLSLSVLESLFEGGKKLIILVFMERKIAPLKSSFFQDFQSSNYNPSRSTRNLIVPWQIWHHRMNLT